MRKHILLLFSLLFGSLSLLAGPLEKGFDALKVFNYFDAKEYFEKAMKNHPAGASYGLSTIFYRTDNPFSNADSANKYIELSEKKFKSSDAKEKETLLKLSITAASIGELKEKIAEQAFENAKKNNTIPSLDYFIKTFDIPALKKDAIKLRNRLAFEAAKRANTAQAYKDFMAKYPTAEDIKDAKWLYDLSLFNNLTTANTLETYENFVKQHPKSPYRMQAEDSIYIFSTKNGTLEEYRSFSKKYPANHNVKKAWEMIYRVSTIESTPAAFANFLFDFPDFPDKPRVKRDIELARTSFFLIQENGKWGFIDSLGNVRIPSTYDWADDFTENAATVTLNDKAGYISKSGSVMIPLIYDEANAFHGGFSIVKNNRKFGLIHKTGKQILALEFDDISYDEKTGGEKIFRTLKEGVYRYFGVKGNLLAEGKFEKAGDFFSGKAYIVQEEKYGFINKKGEIIIPPSYDWVESFHDSVARVKLNEKLGLIDTVGKVILPIEYTGIDQFSEDLALVVREGVPSGKDKKFGFINRKGELIIPFKYDYSPEISSFNGFQNGLAKVELNKKRGLIDKTGKIVVPLEFDDIRNFSEELCAAKKGKWGFIDKNKKQKINFQFEYAWDFTKGLARVKIKGKTGFINPKGEVIITATFDEASDFKNGVSFVLLAGKRGAIDSTGKFVIPAEMDEISEAGNGVLKLEKNGKYAYYNLLLQKQIWTEAGF